MSSESLRVEVTLFIKWNPFCAACSFLLGAFTEDFGSLPEGDLIPFLGLLLEMEGSPWRRKMRQCSGPV